MHTKHSGFKTLVVFVLPILLLTPSISFAASLSTTQVNSILQLLLAFNVDSKTLLAVENALKPSAQTTQQSTSMAGSSPAPLDVSRRPGETDAQYNARMSSFNSSLVGPAATTPPATGPGSLDPTLESNPNGSSAAVNAATTPLTPDQLLAQWQSAHTGYMQDQQRYSALLAERDNIRSKILSGGGVTQSQLNEEVVSQTQALDSQIQALAADMVTKSGLSVPSSTATITGPITCTSSSMQGYPASLWGGEPTTGQCHDTSGMFTANVTVSTDGSLQVSTNTGPMTCNSSQVQYYALLGSEPAIYQCTDASSLITTIVTVSPDGSLQMSTH